MRTHYSSSFNHVTVIYGEQFYKRFAMENWIKWKEFNARFLRILVKMANSKLEYQVGIANIEFSDSESCLVIYVLCVHI